MLASSRLAARRVASCRVYQRFQSTTPAGASSYTSHAVAGLTGGAVVFVGGYAFYHFSGLKQTVGVAKGVHTYLNNTKKNIVDSVGKNPNEVIESLRTHTKMYAGVIPGATAYVDSLFDTLDELYKTHQDDVNRIVGTALTDIQAVIEDMKDGADLQKGLRVFAVLQRLGGEIQEISGKVGRDAFAIFAKANPQVAARLGGGYDGLLQMAEKLGPDARKIADDTARQVQEVFSKGFSEEAFKKAQELLQNKTSELRGLVEKASQDAWDAAMKKAGPQLEKLPEVRAALQENAWKFVKAATSGNMSSVEVFDHIKKVVSAGGDKDKLRELKDFVVKKANEAQEGGSGGIAEKGLEALQKWVKVVPGGEEALKKAPDMKVFVKLAQDKSDEAKQLAQETFDDVFKVLQEKAQKAKKLSSEAAAEVKKES